MSSNCTVCLFSQFIELICKSKKVVVIHLATNLFVSPCVGRGQYVKGVRAYTVGPNYNY